MQNSKKLEKSRGILAFAYNTETTDYEAIAHKTLKVASNKLKLPYTLITEKEYPSVSGNSRYDIDTDQFVQWRNQGRHAAYQLSPYDETLVIDVDYLILDNSLDSIFNHPYDYILQRHSHALTKTWAESMGPSSLPYVWATVFAFRKTQKSKMFFDLIFKIQRNYAYYQRLFNIQERNYRNDYAFAIADIILNGYVIGTNTIAGSMLAVDQPIQTIELKGDSLIIKDDIRAYVSPITNLHIMSKAYLQSDNFDRLIKQL
jgi:hypothetical protein